MESQGRQVVRSLAVLGAMGLWLLAVDASAQPRVHLLAKERFHNRWDNSLRPALEVDPGDIVVFETHNAIEEQLPPGSTADDILKVDRGKVHPLTGPVFVRGAEPGDVLEVRIFDIVPNAWGMNYHYPGRMNLGFLPKEFPDAFIKFFHLDLKTMSAEFKPGIRVALRPFMGTMGVAPREPGQHRTIAPGAHGGNMDNKELVAGTTLYLPVWVRGALFSTGDGHAAQGDGEINITAIETGMRSATMQFFVRKGKQLPRPRAETPTHYITMGFARTLDEAARIATLDMIDYLVEAKGLTRAEAYSLCSVAVDLRITQVVDILSGVHAMLPKGIFTGQ